MRLTAEQLDQYKNKGYISPINALSSSEAKEIRDEIEKIEKDWPGSLEGINRNYIHLISPILNLDSPFKMLQVIENILLYILLTSSYIKLYKNDKKRTLFWLSAFIFAVILYGTLIFNDGTIARYRYVILVFFNFILYIENQELKKNIK